MTTPFRVLYREFLFRIVDRELLSAHSTADSSQLLLQVTALLAFAGALFCVPALGFHADAPPQMRLAFTWTVVHFLIATTMLVVGILTVLSWGSMFPDHRDVLVLAPLPIRVRTVLFAKLAAVVTALGLAVLALNLVAGAVWPAVLNATARAHSIPALTFDPELPPVSAADLQSVMDRDLAGVLKRGPLAPATGGGIAIGVYDRGIRRVFAYGAATPSSIFGIESATKPFTGLVLAQMVEAGLVRLDQPVRELIPEARLPSPPGSEITLLDLATHHSGLPQMPPNLAPFDRANPLANYDVHRLYTYLSIRGVTEPSEAPFAYSNVGFGLLGHALAVRARKDYASLVKDIVTEPLGLTDTVVRFTPAQQQRLIQGHNDDLEPVAPWDLDALAGAGALHSTASDMLAWLEANLHPEKVQPARLSAALKSSTRPRASMGSSGRVALAWMIDPESGDVMHPGNGGGFSADTFFNARDDVAVVVLSNIVVGTVASADIVAEHVRARLRGRPALSFVESHLPPTGGFGHWLRMLMAYWLTVVSAAMFIFGAVLGVQTLAAMLLPRRHFLRVSSVLQLSAFGLIVGVYFVQPLVVQPGRILFAQQSGILGWSPSLWFLGLFQILSGSRALELLADRALIGLSVTVFGSAVAYSRSYLTTLRKIAEQPDTIPNSTHGRWLPPFGGRFPTAIGQFSLRTLFRSTPHRAIVALYWGIGFAVTTVLLKAPRAQQIEDAAAGDWQSRGIALLVSSILMMASAVLAANAAFSFPRDLRANWIFRIVPLRNGGRNVIARRRALMATSVIPIWVMSAVAFLLMWPAVPALCHLAALGLIGLTLIEVCMQGVPKLPFTCSYLPGKSRNHVWIVVLLLGVIPLIFVVAGLELQWLQNATQRISMLTVLVTVWVAARWQTTRLVNAESQPTFEDETADRVLSLDIWDARAAASNPPATTSAHDSA